MQLCDFNPEAFGYTRPKDRKMWRYGQKYDALDLACLGRLFAGLVFWLWVMVKSFTRLSFSATSSG